MQGSVREAPAGAMIGGGLLAESTISAFAVVARRDMSLARPERYAESSGAIIMVHNDDWRGLRGARRTFREHEGRGYWRGYRWTML